MKIFSFALGIAVLATAASVQAANLLTNGNFETYTTDGSTTTFPGWTEFTGTTAAAAHTPLDGSYSAKLIGGNAYVNQFFTPVSQYTLDLDFAAAKPTADNNSRVLSMILVGNTGQINLRIVNNAGSANVQVYSNTWNTILTNAATFSTDLDNNPLKNHLTLAADYSGTPTYTVSITDNGGTVHTSAPVSYFQAGISTSLKGISFHTDYAPTFNTVVDNISIVVPEPATLTAALPLAALALTRRR